MSTNVSLRCKCGKVRGIASGVSPRSGNHIVCYCDDCQAFARFLERRDVLDARGGTDIFQLAPAQLRIDAGAELLRCMRLSEKGMVRWYTGCCSTPVGNTLGARVPFVGVIRAFMDHQPDPGALDGALGKPVGFLYVRCAIGGPPAHAHRLGEMRVMARSLRFLLGWWLGGKGTPSPLFDAQTGAPRHPPRVLSVAERDALRQPG